MKKLMRYFLGGIILGAVILVCMPLFKQGLFDVHDPTSVIRFATLKETLMSGQIPAAWNNNLNNGFGYPIFLYYAPLFTYLGTLLSFILPSYIASLKILIFLTVLCGALGMYRLMNKYGRSVALVSSIAFSFLPYHAVTVYVRGSYSEALTWAILPWMLYFWSRPLERKVQFIRTTVVTALFFLSHNILPFFFLPFLAVWIFLFQKNNLRKAILALVISIGLTAWFLGPILFERSFVQAESRAEQTLISDNFLLPMQLWNSPWGYGGSAPLGEVDGMSFMLGKFQIIIAVISMAYLVHQKKVDKITWFAIGCVVVFAFATTVYSSQLWKIIPFLSAIQFPWRLISYSTFGLAMLDGLIVSHIHNRMGKYAIVIVVTIGVVIFNFKFFRPASNIRYTDSSFLKQADFATVAREKFPEYLPAWMPDFPSHPPQDNLIHSPTKVVGQYTDTADKQLTIDTAYMPQWSLYIDGRQTAISPNEIGSIQTVENVAAGTHAVLLIWQRTVLEVACIVITLSTALIMVVLPI